jgi:two-component system, OmpR family, heavy metal sensor histidine kinase CusS
MKRLPLGRKLTIWSALIVGVVLVLFSAATSVFLYYEEVEAMDGRMRARAAHFLDEFRAHGSQLAWINEEEVKEVLAPGRTPERWVEINGPDGTPIFRSENLAGKTLSSLPPGAHFFQMPSGEVRAWVVSEDGITVRIAEGEDAIEELLDELAVIYCIAVTMTLVAAGFGGWWLSRQALAPVREITAAAEQVTAARLAQRIPVLPVRDEISRLATVLNAMFDRLDVSFQQAMRFSADASHELKTPLTVLRSGLEDLLRSGEVTPAGEPAVAALLEQTRELSAIIASLLLLSRADAGKLQLDLRPSDVSEIVAGCVEDARIMAQERGITIETELSARAFGPVDRGRLTQILLNLLDNAVKYNRDAGTIRVALRSSGQALTATVANTGAGIPPEHAARVFERFHRAEHDAAIPGYGLGLSLARQLARAHGGDLTLTRTDAEWTEFQLTLAAGHIA